MRSPASPPSSGASCDTTSGSVRQFATSLAGQINAAVRDGTFESLVVVADARTLGVLRTRLDAAAQAAVIREIEGDYTKHPVADIRTMLERAT